MKLLQKLTVGLVLASCAVLVANGYFRVKREVDALHEDRIHVHDVIATSLSGAAAAVWKSDGPTRAIAIIEAASTRNKKLQTRWLAEAAPPEFDAAAVHELDNGLPVTRIVQNDAVGTRITVDEVRVDGQRVGYLEVMEPLAAEDQAARRIVLDTILATLSLVLVTGALSVVLGFWFVGRPVRALSQKARRIGRGDFTGPVLLSQKDELSELAEEMNSMCDRLAQETAARVSALDQLRHADRLTTVGKLASGIAHEMGTPLNVVSARAQMIASGEANEGEAKEYARIIVESCAKMTRIIRQLLAFARPKPATKAKLDVARLAADTLELLRPLAQKKRVSLVLEPDDAKDLVCEADGGQMQQALTNLVMNAIQASSDNGKVRVDVRYERARRPREDAQKATDERDWLTVHVKDTGEGIAKEHLGHVFEPFFSTKDVGEGTGLGLSVTHGIVHEHGGFITVSSERARGTEFVVFLPRA